MHLAWYEKGKMQDFPVTLRHSGGEMFEKSIYGPWRGVFWFKWEMLKEGGRQRSAFYKLTLRSVPLGKASGSAPEFT